MVSIEFGHMLQAVLTQGYAYMKFPTASRKVSMNDKCYPSTATFRKLNPADFAISTALSL